MPIWHTHSTVTGSATTLGISNEARLKAAQALARRPTGKDDDDQDDLFEAHFANMDDEGEDTSQDVTPLPEVKQENVLAMSEAENTAPAPAGGDAVMVMGRLYAHRVKTRLTFSERCSKTLDRDYRRGRGSHDYRRIRGGFYPSLLLLDHCTYIFRHTPTQPLLLESVSLPDSLSTDNFSLCPDVIRMTQMHIYKNLRAPCSRTDRLITSRPHLIGFEYRLSTAPGAAR